MTMKSKLVAPGCSPLQKRLTESVSVPPVPKTCFVTGGTGFVGLRLVEMLVERGAEQVISFDIVPIENLPNEVQKSIWRHPNITYVTGDITKPADISRAFKQAKRKVDCVWHIAAAVGPFHPKEVYYKVNVEGTRNMLSAAKSFGVKKFVMSSSPSTRMNGENLDGPTESQLPSFTEMQGKFLQDYAESKFIGEELCRNEDQTTLLTVAVAPHQVYGPRDNLFMPNLLEAAGLGKLRVFGDAKNRVCFSYVDNYCHGLIIAERALDKKEVRGKFYIVTDAELHPYKDGYAYFWPEMDKIIIAMGFDSVMQKFMLPYWFLMPLALLVSAIGYLVGAKFRLSPFTVKMLTMHRWFNVDAARADLDYKPLCSFDDGWKDTADWFKSYWLPGYRLMLKEGSVPFANITATTKAKIDIQSTSVNKQ